MHYSSELKREQKAHCIDMAQFIALRQSSRQQREQAGPSGHVTGFPSEI
jgi:hypothetical protein